MFKDSDLRKNLNWYHFRSFSTGLTQSIFAFIFLFYSQKGFVTSDFGLFESIVFLAIVLFEIPSGILADRWGYKKTLILSDLMMIFYFLILILQVLFYLLL
jgi:MFS family permease